MIKVNSTDLETSINKCLDLYEDPRVPDYEREMYLARANDLRPKLVRAIADEFNDGNQKVLAANEKLAEVNKQLTLAKNRLEEDAKVLSNLAELVGILDGLFGAVASFV